ncbi:MAG TPA: ATP phosphoribosyltransferase regulatory subunit, partial [Candidatus Tectomicrobia bacterium]|nr:ATP phosphoribosyltransferase regulatory subunit [Candidatus Tectomicrobia bacterium]
RSSLAGQIPALAAPLAELSTVARVLESQGVRPAISAVLARRFEYYSGMVIELTVSGERVGAGGRYDDLIAVIGGDGVPACGFALYVTPLLELMPAPSTAGTLRVLVEPEAHDADTLGATQALAARLRDAGVVAETVAGMHTSPSRRVSVRAAQPRYRLDDGRELSDPDDVLNAIEGRS